MSIFLIGAAGLALDGSNLYANRQMAQAAADAAAQAAMLSIFDGSASFNSGTGFTCATNDPKTPCYYAQTLNGFNTAADTVSVDFPSAATVGVPSGTLSSTDPVNLLRVTVSRQVSTTLISLLGPTVSTISASGTAAIVNLASPVPIIVTHPTMSGALNVSASIAITGGPQRSIQINSNGTNPSGNTYTGGGTVDLSGAGPLGTGADFGSFGAPTANPGVTLGTTGHYIDPASPIQDPLAGVSAPSVPTISGKSQPCSVLGHCGGCPGGVATCTEYLPGLYAGGISATSPAIMFDPGVYYMQGGGFTMSSANAGMCAPCSSDPTTKDGMVIYDAASTATGTATGGFNIGASVSAILLGAGVTASSPSTAPTAPYYGILFFEQRDADARSHQIGQGTGCLSATGTIYITNTLSIMQATPAHYQSVSYNAIPCGGIASYGEIIASQLSLAGGLTLPSSSYYVRQVALVN